MTARVGIVTFPGSLDDRDAARAVRRAGAEPVPLWHGDRGLRGVDAVILPGGFSYGDYLRCGAIARFARVMADLVPAARAGLPVLGICNGFQILCEAHLLPGALTRNAGLRFIDRQPRVRIEHDRHPVDQWLPAGPGDHAGAQERRGLPISPSPPRWPGSRTGRAGGRPVRQRDPNGSARDIAGVTNAAGNVVGLMPHPEHAIDPLTGPGSDGLGFFTSVARALVAGEHARRARGRGRRDEVAGAGHRGVQGAPGQYGHRGAWPRQPQTGRSRTPNWA